MTSDGWRAPARVGRMVMYIVVAGLPALVAGAAVAATSGGGIAWEGAWPDDRKELVTLSAEHLPRAEAIRRLADEAHWSVVVEGAPRGKVDVHVTRQPATQVLQLILGVGAGAFTARRQGNLVSIMPTSDEKDGDEREAEADEAKAEQDEHDEGHVQIVVAPKAGGARPPRGKDRVVTGSSVQIGPDEVVGDLVVLGGAADVRGQVTGDVSVFGGAVRVREGGHVYGDVATFGGSVKVDPGGHIDGDVDTIGGSVNRAGAPNKKSPPAAAVKQSSLHGVASSIGGAITRTALLFAFGVVLWALAGRRLERLQEAVVARPMRSFALGVVGALAGAVALIVLCVTVVGIPVALLVGLASVIGTYAGVCAALTTAGAALLRHRTASPYVHLALGCVVYLVLGSIPFVGKFVTVAVVLIGLGALVGTRAAGLIKGGRGSAPAPSDG